MAFLLKAFGVNFDTETYNLDLTLRKSCTVLVASAKHAFQTALGVGNASFKFTFFQVSKPVRVIIGVGNDTTSAGVLSEDKTNDVRVGKSGLTSNLCGGIQRYSEPHGTADMYEAHTITVHNESGVDIRFWLGDTHTSAEGVLEEDSWLKWTFVESRIARVETHHWFEIKNCNARADKFSIGGFHTYRNGDRTHNVGFGDWVFTIKRAWVVSKGDGGNIPLWGD